MPGSDSLVIVLDPGHGGENEGLKHKGLIEKDMNLVTANAMRDELLQYDNVEVYITNPEKADMSLKERAEYADSVGADILISLHFNMSESHQMYGSEVWIPSVGLTNSRMHSLGDVFMEQFDEMEFTLRGVKTRLNDNGLDYYGILRESTALGVPSILVEHGYADHVRDFDKINNEEDWKALGRSDATAVAKFYGLKSSSLGRDFSSYIQNGYFIPEQAVGSDITEPQQCLLVFLETTQEGDLFHVSAVETESEITYYDYTLDGGKTWSEIFPFENDKNAAEFCVSDIPAGGEMFARVYNGHFLYAETNRIYFKKSEEPIAESEAKEIVDSDTQTAMAIVQAEQATAPREEMSPGIKYFSFFGVVLSILLILTAFATYKERMKRRRMGREERRAGFLPIRRMQQIENLCLLAGVCILLCSVTVFGVSFAKSRAAAANPVSVVEHQEADTDRKTADADEEVDREAQDEEIISVLDTERTEGYVLAEEEEIVPGDELLEQMRYNEEVMQAPEKVVVYDIAEGFMSVPLVEGIARNPYDMSGFSGTDLSMNYSANDGVKVMKGIDVSKFQGNVDWQQVQRAGVEFVILRLGLRGYGSGELLTDARFYENYHGATEAGLKVGVYFFSAAVNEEEAREEADYVLQILQECPVEMPVVFDTEPILYDDARTDDLTPNQLTDITVAFCERIRENGYQPMIYANAKRFTTVLHLEKLEAYNKWLADYRQAPDYPYAFTMWQFTEKGAVPGISGNVDMNLYFYRE